VIVVVSDTSPVRALHFLGLLSILKELYGHILIPPAVERELNTSSVLEAIDLSHFDFIEVRAPKQPVRIEQFMQSLHLGESEAMALALEVRATAVLIDEAAGRRAAARLGIRALGTLGILLEAAKGHIEEIRPLLDKLVDELGFFVSRELKQTVLKLAGE